MILVGDGAVFLYTAALLSPKQQNFPPEAGTHSANLQRDRYVPSPELYLINTVITQEYWIVKRRDV